MRQVVAFAIEALTCTLSSGCPGIWGVAGAVKVRLMTGCGLSVDRTSLERANEGGSSMGDIAGPDGQHDIPFLQERINRGHDIGHPGNYLGARANAPRELR